MPSVISETDAVDSIRFGLCKKVWVRARLPGRLKGKEGGLPRVWNKLLERLVSQSDGQVLMDNSGSSTRVEGSVEEKYAPLLAINRLGGGLLGGSKARGRGCSFSSRKYSLHMDLFEPLSAVSGRWKARTVVDD
jgi:hypothetical protein